MGTAPSRFPQFFFLYPCSTSHHLISSQLYSPSTSLQLCTDISFAMIPFLPYAQRLSLHLSPTRHATILPIYLPTRRHKTLHRLRRQMWRLLGNRIRRPKASLPHHSTSRPQARDHDSSLSPRNRQRVSHDLHHAIALQLHAADKGVRALLLLRLSGAMGKEAQHMSDLQGRALRTAMQEEHGRGCGVLATIEGVSGHTRYGRTCCAKDAWQLWESGALWSP